jgi:hypothetical protein
MPIVWSNSLKSNLDPGNLRGQSLARERAQEHFFDFSGRFGDFSSVLLIAFGSVSPVTCL